MNMSRLFVNIHVLNQTSGMDGWPQFKDNL